MRYDNIIFTVACCGILLYSIVLYIVISLYTTKRIPLYIFILLSIIVGFLIVINITILGIINYRMPINLIDPVAGDV